MSIFEDLIEELKEENLLEETVIEAHKEPSAAPNSQMNASFQLEQNSGDKRPAGTNSPAESEAFSFFEEAPVSTKAGDYKPLAGDDFFGASEIQTKTDLSRFAGAASAPVPAPNAFVPVAEEKKFKPVAEAGRPRGNEKEYFRKRAMEEVTGLQMVDHVISGVERDQLNTVPKPFDDLPVKLALHDFMQVSVDTKSSEHAQAEFRLMQETENWYSTLSYRDKNITVGHLRRFCETTRPALSSQALNALARFYRNSPFSEHVRSKFELILTRLYGKETGDDKRELLFSREELILQIKELYADWSSIQLYSAEEDDSEILIIKLKFDDFIDEAETATGFEALITNNFFNRLRAFKESCQENFFAPQVAATAIEANVRIGNRAVELLQKDTLKAAFFEEKYGFLHDQSISDATGKSFQLIELLKPKAAKTKPAEIVEVKVKATAQTPYKPKQKEKSRPFWKVNKWVLIASVITLLICGAVYFWANSQSNAIQPSPNVKKVNLENSSLKEYLQAARISDAVFYGITLESWDASASEKKEELLKKILSIGAEKGFRKVQLINQKGKTVGFASAEKVEVINP